MASEKKVQVLQVDPPSELIFQGPFTDVVTSSLKLTNPSNNPVVFKVKTTAPKQYCVRPNSGILQPQEFATIAVMLQPFDASSTDRSKHKFMVQSLFAQPGFNPDQLDAIWKKADKNELMDCKLKCTFVEGEESAEPSTADTQPDNETGTVNTVDVTPTAEQSAPSEADPLDSGVSVDEGEKVTGTHPKLDQSHQQPTAGSTPAPVPVFTLGGGSGEESQEKEKVEANIRLLQEKVEKLSTENNQLKNEGNKLRQRLATTPPVPLPGTKSVPHPSSSDSSPLNMIAIILILLALLFGYFVGRWM